MKQLDQETKSIITDLINKFVKMLNINSLTSTVFDELKKGYDKGILEAEDQFNLNFTRDTERLEFLQKYSFDNIVGMNNDIAEKLRGELQRAFMNLESIDKIKARVVKVMDVAEDRARAIARTEMTRAHSMGHIDSARQSGLNLKKYVSVHIDTRTSPICKRMNSKYGTPDKAIPIDSKFIDKESGQEFDISPFHVNCRTAILFSQVDK